MMGYINGFLGVYSSNNAVKLRKKGESLIINFDKEGEPGSHFVCLYMKNRDTCLYFDSLNLPIIPTEIYSYLSCRSFNVKNCSKDIQSFNSSYCGFYCMLFIICNKISFKYWEKVSKNFKTRCMSNDKKCIDYLCLSIKKMLK